MTTDHQGEELTTVHLLRHGEVHNPDGVLYGRLPNFHLSDRGRLMAARVAEHLAGNPITVVVASPLDRAQETAEPIAAEHGVAVDVDDRLIEAANVFEGLTFGVGDGALTRPTHWKHLRNPFRPSWGERYTDQVRRMLGVMADARDRARGAGHHPAPAPAPPRSYPSRAKSCVDPPSCKSRPGDKSPRILHPRCRPS